MLIVFYLFSLDILLAYQTSKNNTYLNFSTSTLAANRKFLLLAIFTHFYLEMCPDICHIAVNTNKRTNCILILFSLIQCNIQIFVCFLFDFWWKECLMWPRCVFPGILGNQEACTILFNSFIFRAISFYRNSTFLQALCKT